MPRAPARSPRKNARIDAFVLDALGFDGPRENPRRRAPRDPRPSAPYHQSADPWAVQRALIAEHRMHARAARQQARYDPEAREVAEHHDAEAERLEAELEAAGHKRPRGARYRPNPHRPDGDAIAAWCDSDESYAVLDETSSAGSSWMAGACVLLAKAIRKRHPEATLVGIETDHGIQHVGARIGDTVYDALGEHDPHAWVRDWLAYEQLPSRTLARVVRLAGVPRGELPDAESPATPADVALVARALPDVRVATLRSNPAARWAYHVTYKDELPSIRSKGLVPQTDTAEAWGAETGIYFVDTPGYVAGPAFNSEYMAWLRFPWPNSVPYSKNTLSEFVTKSVPASGIEVWASDDALDRHSVSKKNWIPIQEYEE